MSYRSATNMVILDNKHMIKVYFIPVNLIHICQNRQTFTNAHDTTKRFCSSLVRHTQQMHRSEIELSNELYRVFEEHLARLDRVGFDGDLGKDAVGVDVLAGVFTLLDLDPVRVAYHLD